MTFLEALKIKLKRQTLDIYNDVAADFQDEDNNLLHWEEHYRQMGFILFSIENAKTIQDIINLADEPECGMLILEDEENLDWLFCRAAKYYIDHSKEE